MKLNLLYKASSLRQMCQQNLFPSSEELVSLNMELGVPVLTRIKEDDNELISYDSIDDYYSEESIIYSCDMY